MWIKILRNIILSLLCGCEFPRHFLGEERRLIVLENKVLREIFGPLKEQVKEGLRKRRIEELNALLYSTSITILIQGPINTAPRI
jgi:hypothetical protein